MKRFFSGTFTFLTLIVIIGVLFLYIHSWGTDESIDVAPTENHQAVSVKQPVIETWVGDLDNSGYDVSFPQCRQSLPEAFVGFVIIGLNNGRPFTGNPCFARQWEWAKSHDAAAVYINMDDTGKYSPEDYGRRIGQDAVARLAMQRVPQGTPVWLDVERNNAWDSAPRAVTVINATMVTLANAGYPVGIYAAPAHWFEITIGTKVKVPIWYAIGPYPTTQQGVMAAKKACTTRGFGGAKPSIVQFVSGVGEQHLDRNIMCRNPTGLVARQ